MPIYDLKPEMSAVEVTDRLVDAIAASCFDLIVVNYANGDMVGPFAGLTMLTKNTFVSWIQKRATPEGAALH